MPAHPVAPEPVRPNADVSATYQRFCRLVLRMMGWRIGKWALPYETDKAIVLGEHHTSNMDAVLMVFVVGAMGRKLNWLAKKELDKPIIGAILRATGAIFVDRHAPNGMVGQAADMIRANERMFLAMAPSATRSKTDRWRTGFYYMAMQADVPVVLGYLDYASKDGGLGEVVTLSGDMAADEPTFQRFYANINARYPEKASAVRLVPSGKDASNQQKAS